MKKLISIVLVLTMLFSLAPMAFGAEDEAKKAADSLNKLGLFAGTGTNPDGTPIYNLEGIPTRSQAIIMLVKLLGKETEAINGTWETPFTDVANWAKPFVGYAYANGLTAGTSATTFGGNDPVTATQYLTFVLKALGYEVGKDFQWNKAWELSDKLGITDGRYNENNKTFLRGDIATISDDALDKPVVGKNMALITMIRQNLAAAEAEQPEEEQPEMPEEPKVEEPAEQPEEPVVEEPKVEVPLKPVIPEGIATLKIQETGDEDVRVFQGKVGKTYTATLWYDGEQVKDLKVAKSENSKVCTVKKGSNGVLSITTTGAGEATLTIEFFAGYWEHENEDGTVEGGKIYKTTNMHWYGYSGDSYKIPGVSLRQRGQYYENGARFGDNFGEYHVFDIMYNGQQVTDYTVTGFEGLEYKIQSDGTLLVYHEHKKGHYPFTVTHNGNTGSFTLVVSGIRPNY
ncbi:MAG: S-layer homology domain-containing protein [Firmicutes bacterium]|nr:S-layer homology domain-containing protein [Bacillota bacterium]